MNCFVVVEGEGWLVQVECNQETQQAQRGVTQLSREGARNRSDS